MKNDKLGFDSLSEHGHHAEGGRYGNALQAVSIYVHEAVFDCCWIRVRFMFGHKRRSYKSLEHSNHYPTKLLWILDTKVPRILFLGEIEIDDWDQVDMLSHCRNTPCRGADERRGLHYLLFNAAKNYQKLMN
jgi:hypothetical protein